MYQALVPARSDHSVEFRLRSVYRAEMIRLGTLKSFTYSLRSSFRFRYILQNTQKFLNVIQALLGKGLSPPPFASCCDPSRDPQFNILVATFLHLMFSIGPFAHVLKPTMAPKEIFAHSDYKRRYIASDNDIPSYVWQNEPPKPAAAREVTLFRVRA